MPKPRKHEERDTQEAILLKCGGLPAIRLWRQHVGRARALGSGQVMTFGLPGAADLTGILACGKRAEVEVKSPKGRLREEQKLYRTAIENMSGFHVVARSVEDVTAALKEHGRWCTICARLIH